MHKRLYHEYRRCKMKVDADIAIEAIKARRCSSRAISKHALS